MSLLHHKKKRVKRYFNPYVPVSILTVIVLYVIGSVGVGCFPLIGECKNAERINGVLINLSYSFIASVMFFLMMNILPRWRDEKKAEEVFHGQLNEVTGNLNHFMAMLKMMAGIKKADKDIMQKDFSSLSNLSTSLRSAYVECTMGDGKYKEQGAIDCYAYLEYYSKIIKQKLQDILELPASSMLRQELIEILVELKMSDVLSTCARGFKHVSSSEQKVYTYNLDNQVYPFFQLYKRLEKCVNIKPKYHFSIIPEKDRDDLHKKLMDLLSVAYPKNTSIDAFSEVHYNHTFLCFYAMPEQFK